MKTKDRTASDILFTYPVSQRDGTVSINTAISAMEEYAQEYHRSKIAEVREEVSDKELEKRFLEQGESYAARQIRDLIFKKLGGDNDTSQTQRR